MKNYFRKYLGIMAILCMASYLFSCGEDENPVVPMADFEAAVNGFEVDFTNKSKDATEFAWDFDDGNTSTEVSPTHTYDAYGDYEVKLIVKSADGTTAETTKTVSIVDACASWDGTEANNAIVGGQFETCDAKYWSTIIPSDEGDAKGPVKYQFGYTDYAPADGTDGALYIHPDNDTIDGTEAVFLYQKVTVTEGEYEIGALIQLAGEDQAEPLSAMNNYWFQFYVGKTEPVNRTDYTDGQMSGWIYGGWTGWSYEIPPTDGPLVHNYLAANIASAEGRFNLDNGDYYVGIKVGKGGDGASFGDGIAVDNFYLTRVGDRNACFDWDGTQVGNLVKGGQFEECDDKYWTLLKGDANLPLAPGEFGYTTYVPTSGAGGAFYAEGTTTNSSSTLYQYIGELEAGTYQLDADIKFGDGMAAYWYEILVWTEEPEDGVGYSPKDENDNAVPRVTGYLENTWGCGVTATAYDGEMDYDFCSGNQADADGKFTIAEGGHYFFVLKWGVFNGNLGEGIAIDNVTLSKVE